MCPRCKGIMKDGSISNKGEHLCACCIGESEKLQCNAPIYSTILSLKCCCPLSKRGCDWLGTLGSIEDHLTTCGHLLVWCELMCGEVLAHNKMKRHLRKECPLRGKACPHCSEMYTMCDMADHVKACGMVKIKCELGCGARVRRESMLSHRKTECLEEIIVCPYAKYRCEVAGLKRRELEQHLEERRMVHMELKLNAVAEKVEVLELQIIMKDEEIQFLKEEVLMKQEETVKWNIKDISAQLKPGKGPRYSSLKKVAGYPFYLGHETSEEDFKILFSPLTKGQNTSLLDPLTTMHGLKLELLEWPLRVIFITRFICHGNADRTLVLRSSPAQFLQKDFGVFSSNARPICSIPLSTNWGDFIQSECLNLEVTLRILKIR